MGTNETGYIGQSVRRKEDARFLMGAGQYTDDVTIARFITIYSLQKSPSSMLCATVAFRNLSKSPCERRRCSRRRTAD